MADEVENMMYVGPTPWHGKGTSMIVPPETVDEAMVAGGLAWRVETHPVFAHVGDERLPTEYKSVVRTSDMSVLGVVGGRYHPVQNVDAFDFFNPIIQNKLATIETCGSLRSGKRVWMLAKIAGLSGEVVNGDELNRYFLVSSSHDGTTTVNCGSTDIRVVCQNTLSAAHNSSASKLLKIRHTKNAVDALQKIREIVDSQRADFAATLEQMKVLASKGVTKASLKEYVREVFDIGDNEDKLKKVLDKKIIPLFEAGKGTDIQGVNGTMWGAYNSVTEYLTWFAGRSVDTRLDSLWFGQSANLNRKAFEVAVQMAA
jgi:phage/plasmid-like protein (TIGR03299 family)